MANLANVHRAVKAAIASKRIGTPVFVRYTLYTVEGGLGPEVGAEHVSCAVHSWIGQTIEKLYVLQKTPSQVAVSIQFREGATALVNVIAGSQAPRGADVVVLGNRGAIYHENLAGADLGDRLTLPEKCDAPIQPGLRDGWQEAWRTGKPVLVPEKDKPDLRNQEF